MHFINTKFSLSDVRGISINKFAGVRKFNILVYGNNLWITEATYVKSGADVYGNYIQILGINVFVS
jgi:hypothetical protein